MLRFFIRIPDIAAAESDAAAERLIARGYTECNHDYYMAWWQLRDSARRSEFVMEDAQAMIYANRARHGG